MERFGMTIATASVPPEEIIINNNLSKMMDTSDEWISSRTGIRERRCVANQETSDLCVLVAGKLIKQRNLNPKGSDLISVATMSSDYMTPSVATQVQGKLGTAHAIAFDISATCSGFAYALSVAKKMIRYDSTKGLMIGGETLFKLIDWPDCTTAMLFDDEAGEILLETNPQKELLRKELAADGTRSSSSTAGYQQNKNLFYSEDSEGPYYLQMTGRDIFDFAVRDVANNIQEVMKDKPADYLLSRQANLRTIGKTTREVKMPREKLLASMDKYENTSATGTPILLDEAASNGKVTLEKQQKVIFTDYDGDLTWGSILMEL